MESEYGKGAKFYFTLTFKLNIPSPLGFADESPVPPSHKMEVIIVAENESMSFLAY